MFNLKNAKITCFTVLVCLLQTQYAIAGKAKNNGTWKDPKTGLVWQRCSLGQTWNGVDCDGTPITYNWADAQEAAKALGAG